MSEDKLALKKRTITGKKLKNLRKEGIIPSVVYGGEKEPVMTESPYNITEKVLKSAGYHSPVDLTIDSKPQMALVKNVDIDPVKRTIRNVEFQAISANEVVEAKTPIIIINWEGSEAQKISLSTLQVMEEISIKAKPADLPSQIEVDASNLATIEDRLTVADLKIPKGVELADKELDPETAVVTVLDPVAEAAAREAETAAAQAELEATAAEAVAEGETPATDAPAEEAPKAE